MSNYDMDEIDRLNEKEKSQKQKEQWRDYVTNSLKHPLDSSEVDDQENIRKIRVKDWKRNPLKNVPLPLVDDNTSREELDMLRRPFEKEEVTNPKHYNERKMEPLDYIIANELDFLEGNIIKYITRYTYKGGVNDLLKARTYLEKLIEREKDGR